jgi:metallophosphoesterase (TIGR00282 family)
MIGDVVGDAGIEAVEAGLGDLVRELGADFTVVNGENAAGGFGLTAETLARLLAAGADLVTSGNHVWEKREVWPTLESESRVLRPANYPAGAVGRGSATVEKDGILWAVVNIQGREDMSPIDCPFRIGEELARGLAGSGALVLVDFHAESTQEKEALAFHLDGLVSALAGTHTHVQTADARVLPKGTAYITDLGMTGVRDGIIGMDAEICVERGRTQVPRRMELAVGAAGLRGALIEIDRETRKAVRIEAVERVLTALNPG